MTVSHQHTRTEWQKIKAQMYDLKHILQRLGLIAEKRDQLPRRWAVRYRVKDGSRGRFSSEPTPGAKRRLADLQDAYRRQSGGLPADTISHTHATNAFADC